MKEVISGIKDFTGKKLCVRAGALKHQSKARKPYAGVWNLDYSRKEINLKKKSILLPICYLATTYVYIIYSDHTHASTHSYFPTK